MGAVRVGADCAASRLLLERVRLRILRSDRLEHGAGALVSDELRALQLRRTAYGAGAAAVCGLVPVATEPGGDVGGAGDGGGVGGGTALPGGSARAALDHGRAAGVNGVSG